MSSVDIKNTFTSVGELNAAVPPSSLVLKLSITQRSIRYFIQSASHDQIIFYGDHILHHVENEAALVQRIERIFEKDEVLQLTFGEIFIGINPPYTLIPSGFYLPDETLPGISINQKIDSAGIDIVFNLDSTLFYKLKSLFGKCHIGHLNASLLYSLPAYLNETGKLFINIEADQFDVIRFNTDGQLQLMNRYRYQTETDFAYFLLLCCEELKVDREQTELVLAGEVDVQSKIYDMCYRYFRKISFIQPPGSISFSKAFETFPKHHHFNLYTLNK